MMMTSANRACSSRGRRPQKMKVAPATARAPRSRADERKKKRRVRSGGNEKKGPMKRKRTRLNAVKDLVHCDPETMSGAPVFVELEFWCPPFLIMSRTKRELKSSWMTSFGNQGNKLLPTLELAKELVMKYALLIDDVRASRSSAQCCMDTMFGP